MSDVIRRIQNRPKANPEVVFAREIAALKRTRTRYRVLLIGSGLGATMALVVLGLLYFLGVVPPR